MDFSVRRNHMQKLLSLILVVADNLVCFSKKNFGGV